MSLIRNLEKIITDAEDEYKKLLAEGTDAVYRREMAVNGTDGSNYIVHCDNLELLADGIRNGSLKEKIDLIYCDPPFFTQDKQETTVDIYSLKNQKKVKLRQRAYSDTWNYNMPDYLKMIAVRLYLMRDTLKDEGSIFIHLDWHAVHAVKLIMDEIFGEENFINEIIWTYKSGGATKRHFSRKHDTILFYGKSDKYKFNQQEKEKSYNRDFKPYRFKGVEEFQDDVGWYTMVNPRDVWHIDAVGRSSGERLNYATQKPEALIERIVKAVTEPGDLCADFFCGSGTLAAAASTLGRRFICADSGELAVSNVIKRLLLQGAAFELWNTGNQNECEYDFMNVRPADRKKAEELVLSDPEAFTDYYIEGRTDASGCLYPSKAVFKTTKGMKETVIDAGESTVSAVMTADVFGRRNIKLK
jgi:DNA modification methylase